ncbi:MAG TPA: LysR substrate-binding domain-containing protein, partial [Steroidobacteraceae bacterium]|nr:LysR substrate-binding domain-containing protein [Steroidobacteraceae bacterium]
MHTSLPSLEGILAVIAAHETGSFSGAADRLGITHGAVSRRVQAVEHWLATPLFERGARGVQVTPAGQRFIATAQQALATIRESADRWRPVRAQPVVRVSVVPSFARLWLMSRMTFLQGQPADVRIELQLEHRAVDLSADEADISVRYGKGAGKDVRGKLLFREHLYPVAAPSLAKQLGANAKPDRIAELPLLHDSDTRQWRAWLDAAGSRFRNHTHDRRFEDYDLVLAACEAGLGIALLRAPLADSYVNSGRLVQTSKRAIPNVHAHYLTI